MITIIESKYNGLLYINGKPMIKENLEFWSRSDKFTQEELDAAGNYIKASDDQNTRES